MLLGDEDDDNGILDMIYRIYRITATTEVGYNDNDNLT